MEAGTRSRENWSNGRIVAMVFACLAGLIGLLFLVGGLVAVGAHLFARDADGYYTSDEVTLESSNFAIRTEEIDLGADDVDWAPEEILGDVRIRVTSETDKPVFVGIGPDGAVAAYLRGVGQDELTDLDSDPPELTASPGGPPRRAPGDLRFWVAQASGAGQQELNWDADFGRWSAVVMNADGSGGIDVEADAGVKIGWVIWVGLGLLIVGLIIDGASIALMLLIIRGAERKGTPVAG